MQRGLDMTVAYSKERHQFGRPIGSFQALKHRMADMLVLVEASRSASWAATAAAAAYVAEPDDQRAEILARRAAVARPYCSDALDSRLRDRPAARRHRDHLGARRPPGLQARPRLSRLWEPAHVARAVLGSGPVARSDDCSTSRAQR